jgi:hypothetical protein
MVMPEMAAPDREVLPFLRAISWSRERRKYRTLILLFYPAVGFSVQTLGKIALSNRPTALAGRPLPPRHSLEMFDAKVERIILSPPAIIAERPG